MTFFITGLPRSRTAWLANWLSTGDVFCYHDIAARMISDIEQLPQVFERSPYKHTGVSDPSLGFFMARIVDMVPRILIVDRDLDEVQADCTRIGLPMAETNFLEVMRDHLWAYRRHPSVLWVPFERLDEQRVAQKIHLHLLPGVPFDETRYRELCMYHVEVNMRKSVQCAFEHKAEAETLFASVSHLWKLKDENHVAAAG